MADSITDLQREADQLRTKLEQARKALQQIAESGAESDAVLVELGDAVAELGNKAEKAASKVAAATQKQKDAIAAVGDRSRGLLLKTFGGEETAEKFQSFSEALKISRGHITGLDGASLSLGTRLQAGAAAAGIAAQQVGAFGSSALQAIQHLRELSAQVDEADRRVEQLGSSLAEAQHATQGTVSATELFAVQQQLLGERVQPTARDLAVLSRQLREYSIEMGGSAQQNTQQFLAALQSGDTDTLARFGVNLQGVTSHTERFRLAMEQFRAQQQGRPLIPRTETEALQAESRELDTLTGRASRLALQYSGIRLVVPLVEGAINRLNNLFGSQRDETEAASGAALRASVTLAQEATAMESAGTKAHGLASATAAVTAETDKMSFALRAGETEVDRLSRRLAVARDRIGAVRNQSAEDSQIRRQLRSEGFSGSEISSAGIQAAPSGGGSGQASQIAAARAQLAALQAEARTSYIELPEVIRRIGETRLEFLQRSVQTERDYLQLVLGNRREQFEQDFRLQQERQKAEKDSEDALFESVTRRAQANRDASQQGHLNDSLALQSLNRRIALASEDAAANDRLAGTEREREALKTRFLALRDEENSLLGQDTEASRLRVAAIDSERDGLLRLIEASAQLQQERQRSLDFGVQFTEAFRRDANLTQTGAQSMARTVMGSFNGIVQSIRAHSAALIEGRETAGEAFRAIAHEALLGLATEAIGQAIFQTAAGVAALTNPVTAVTVAPQHFASAALYAGVAALGGIGAAATAAPAAAPQKSQFASGSSAGVGSSLGAPSSERGNITITYQIAGNVFAGKESAEEATAQFVRGAYERGLLPTGT